VATEAAKSLQQYKKLSTPICGVANEGLIKTFPRRVFLVVSGVHLENSGTLQFFIDDCLMLGRRHLQQIDVGLFSFCRVYDTVRQNFLDKLTSMACRLLGQRSTVVYYRLNPSQL
jgi:hypothetical protein